MTEKIKKVTEEKENTKVKKELAGIKKTSLKKPQRRDVKVDTKVVFDIPKLEEAMRTKQVFEAYIEDVDNFGNLSCIFASGIKAIIPKEEVAYVGFDDREVDLDYCQKKKGKIMSVCIKDLCIKDGKVESIVLSRKELELKVRKWMYMHLKPGMRLKGVVRSMNDHMAFVDVGGGVTGTLKVSEIANIRIMKVSDRLHLGQRLECTVIKYDKDTGKIDLSIKGKEKTFAEITKKFKEGDIVKGIVRNRIKNGIFIELSNDLMAMADHVSGVEYGQEILVHIKRISQEKEKVKVEIIG